MAETVSIKLPYAVGIQLRRLAGHYGMPMTAVIADLVRRESIACDIPLADELEIAVEDDRLIIDVFGLRLPTLSRSQAGKFASDLKHIAQRGGELLQLDAEVEIKRRGTGIIVDSPDGSRSMSVESALKMSNTLLGFLIE